MPKWFRSETRSLDRLARKWGTDKSSRKHDYCRVYAKIFGGIERPRLFEIGIKEGASLRMWEEYFPGGRICALDLDDPPSLVAHLDTEKGDQGDPAVLQRCIDRFAPFDIVIDDGSHRWEHQILALEMLFPALRPGGLFVIEDLQTSYRPEFGQPGSETAIEYLKRLVDPLNGHGRFRRARDVEVERDHPVASSLAAVAFHPFMAVLEKR